MKTLLLILLTAASAIAQTPNPPARPVHPHPSQGFTFVRAVVNTPFATKPIPALVGETGCSLTVSGGPKTTVPQDWKLAAGVFSGTPTAEGLYRLAINCTTPAATKETVTLMVSKTAPPNPPPAPPAPTPIPLD